MTPIQDEIEAFRALQAKLEADHLGEWVVMRDCVVIGLYKSFEQASSEALKRFGRGPYLIREIGAKPLHLPVSVMYHRYAG